MYKNNKNILNDLHPGDLVYTGEHAYIVLNKPKEDGGRIVYVDCNGYDSPFCIISWSHTTTVTKAKNKMDAHENYAWVAPGDHVIADITPPSIQPVNYSSEYKVLNTQGLNVRSGPGASFTLITKLAKDTHLWIDDREAQLVVGTGYSWAPCQLEDGTEGWIAISNTSWIERIASYSLIYYQQATYQAMQSTNIKNKPYDEASTVDTLSSGSTLLIQAAYENQDGEVWYKLANNDGFVFSDDLAFVESNFDYLVDGLSLPGNMILQGVKAPFKATITSTDSVLYIDGVIHENYGDTIQQWYSADYMGSESDFTVNTFDIDQLGINDTLDTSVLPCGDYVFQLNMIVAYSALSDRTIIPIIFDTCHFSIVDAGTYPSGPYNYTVEYEVVGKNGQYMRSIPVISSSTIVGDNPKGTYYWADTSKTYHDGKYIWAPICLADGSTGWACISAPSTAKMAATQNWPWAWPEPPYQYTTEYKAMDDTGLDLRTQPRTVSDSLITTLSGVQFLADISKTYDDGTDTWAPVFLPDGTSGWVIISNHDNCVPMSELLPGGLEIDETNFPDEHVRSYVESDVIDVDQDGYLSESEALAVTRLDFSSMNVADLTGIGYFPALTSLTCCDNQLTALDVSANTELTTLFCSNNQLTTLDVSKNSALLHLACDSNQLTMLDMSKNTVLNSLVCGCNQLTSLDVRNNTALIYLDCGNNQLTSLDVSQNLALDTLLCTYNQLTTLDVSNHTALLELYCSSNQLTSLDVSNNTALRYLDCRSNQLTSLDVSQNLALDTLLCTYNQLTSLDVSNNTALIALYCSSNSLIYLDLSHNSWIKKLSCGYNCLTSLDLSGITLNDGSAGYSAEDLAGNVRNINAVGGAFDLSTLPGFDVTKASEWEGGTVSGTILTVIESCDVTYVYDCGNDRSALFTLHVTVTGASKPTITTQPVSVTVQEGETATFTVEAEGAGLSYQWYYKKPGTTTWTTVKNNGKSATYTLTTEARHNGYSYRCKVTNSAGSTTSSEALLTVVTQPPAEPVITSQPVDVTVTEGAKATFRVVASGEGLTYQWYYQTPSSATWNIVKTKGKSATYTVTTEARHNGYQYACVVTYAEGSATSNAATLTVIVSEPVPNEPVITGNPVDVTVTAGQKATFRVIASGDGLTYQWYYQTPSSATWNIVKTKGKSATYTVTTEARHNGYQYACVVTNAEGSTTSDSATLTVE